jgi:hypothetical protein
MCRREKQEMNMQLEWIATEHHRLHVIEQWPESPLKEAALAATRSTLESLLRRQPVATLPVCSICSSRKRSSTVVPFPEPFQIDHLAA